MDQRSIFSLNAKKWGKFTKIKNSCIIKIMFLEKVIISLIDVMDI